MTRFAEGTTVPIERSRAEIESLLMRYGADEFGSIRLADHAAVMFRCKGLHVQFVVRKTTRSDVPTKDRRCSWKSRTEDAIRADMEAEDRRRWRSLLLVVKAKIEAVATGITTFEKEFLAYVVMADGRAFGDVAVPRLKEAAASGLPPTGIPLIGPAT